VDPLLAQREQRSSLAHPTTALSSPPSPWRPLALAPPRPRSRALAALALAALTRRSPASEGVILPKGAFAVAKMLDGVISQQESYGLEEVRILTLASPPNPPWPSNFILRLNPSPLRFAPAPARARLPYPKPHCALRRSLMALLRTSCAAAPPCGSSPPSGGGACFTRHEARRQRGRRRKRRARAGAR
jgi:hypothetical protein